MKASPHAWPSFLLGSSTLFENAPIIQIAGVAFAPGGAKSTKPSPSLEIRVTVKDGNNPAPVDAAKVAALFTATVNPSDWTSAPLPVEASKTGQDGYALLFDIVPGVSTETAVFLRLAE